MSTNSKLPFTSVVSYHTNPMTCGVAKFSAELAKRLGVPFVGLDEQDIWGVFPLLSLKDSELTYNLQYEYLPDTFGVFWHDSGRGQITERATITFYADPSLGAPGLWCPSLLTPSKPRTVRLFSFGMAHKIQTQHYAKVRHLLEAAGLDYRLRVSVGLHEGTDLADATKHFDALRDIMGANKVTILGILSDDAVSEELQNADYVLAFFEKGLRANNTTVHAALDYGKVVVTNHDAHTPSALAARTRDVHGDWLASPSTYSWDELIRQMQDIYANAHDWHPAHI